MMGLISITRRAYRGVSLFLLAVLIAGCAGQPYRYHGPTYDLPHPAPDFNLPAASGMSTPGLNYHLATQKGRAVLIYFGYTHCPDECPITLALLAQVKHKLPDKPLDLVFITVDPENDTPQVIADYANNFDPSIITISVDKNTVLPLLQSYGGWATYHTATAEASGKSSGGLDTHTDSVYLIDPAGNLLVQYAYPVVFSDLLADLQYLFETMPPAK
jgi:protein SCO1/2